MKLILLFLLFTSFLYCGGVIQQPVDIKTRVERTEFDKISTDNIYLSTITFSDGTVLRSTSDIVGVRTFLDLIDTPSSYIGHSGKVARVKTDETGIEFAVISGGGGAGDNLGNHIATQNLNLSSFAIVNVSTITFLDGTKMISVPIFATRIIAASNSEPKWKAIAHYVCDGNDDQVEIQQAINEVNALKGGRVLLCNGTYYLSKEICTNERHNITLEGMDKIHTVITVKNYSGGYGIIMSTTLAARWHNWTIRNITFRDIPVPVIGCVASGSNMPYMNFFTFEDNIIDNCQEGIKLGGENIEGRMNNFRIVKNIFKVIYRGVTINADAVVLEGNYIFSQTSGRSIEITRCKNVVVSNGIFEFSTTGEAIAIHTNDCKNIIISNNVIDFKGNYGNATGHNNGIEVFVYNYPPENITIIGNKLLNCGGNRPVISLYAWWNSPVKNIYNVMIMNNQIINCGKGIGIGFEPRGSYGNVYNLMVMNNQTVNCTVPYEVMKNQLYGTYHAYNNSWETDVIDFDKGIVANSLIFKTRYNVGSKIPDFLGQVIVDDNYNMWISTGTSNAWQWKLIGGQ
ncbi:MAG: hypothetical protein N2Z73_03695 [Endomicrobia bacterium]|nr:hypothetical protein [Endomicrobiia bacterium]